MIPTSPKGIWGKFLRIGKFRLSRNKFQAVIEIVTAILR